MKVALPSAWNRSRATALGVTLVLHVAAALWLLALRFDRPSGAPPKTETLWVPLPARAPPPPATQPEAPPTRIEPSAPILLPEPAPDLALPPVLPDWHGSARDVAGALGGGPSRRTFGEAPGIAPKRPKEEAPPTIWDKPLPRVGTTVTTPEGETILWVSDYCYISLGTRSLTLDHIHQGRQGVRTCVLYQFGGEKKARDDLFDSIKR